MPCLHCAAPADPASSLCAACSALSPEPRASRSARQAARAARPREQSILSSAASPGQGLSPADFARALLLAAGPGGRSARELLKALREAGPLVVNGRPAGLAEVRQASARLAREGLASFCGDMLRPA
jgi:hypothetical protein